uniref:Uncharacterized protein n=1 Tax=viral metagenome TaxID=1070528 RepID=A0A6H1ZA43_9ZZZZ
MNIDWTVDKCIQGARLYCHRIKWNYHPSFDSRFQFCRCEGGHQHVMYQGIEIDLVDARKYAKFYPMTRG